MRRVSTSSIHSLELTRGKPGSSSFDSVSSSAPKDLTMDEGFAEISLNSPNNFQKSNQDIFNNRSDGEVQKDRENTPIPPERSRTSNELLPTNPSSPRPCSPLSPMPQRGYQFERILTRSPKSFRAFDLEGQQQRDGQRDLESSPSKIPLPTSSAGSSSKSNLLVPRSAPPHTSSFHNSNQGPGEGSHAPYPHHMRPHSDQLEDDSGNSVEAPFESISLSSTPPAIPVPSIPLPSSPKTFTRSSERRSWGGFGILKNGVRVTEGELPEHVSSPLQESGSQPVQELQIGYTENEERNRTSASTPTSRRTAPTPHPFPWPIPKSPSEIADKRLSTMSTSSNVTHTSQASVSASQTHTHAPALGVKGASAFEKVLSQTRPSWLPPKDRQEDVTHLHQWEELMRQSREHERQLAKLAETRRIEKEKRLITELPMWNKLLSEGFSVQKVQQDAGLRKMWFEGVPSHLRGKAWALAVGNPLALSKDVYRIYLARARKGLENERFPPDLLQTIEHDLDDTLVTLKLFQRDSPLRDDLKELICAWLVYRSDEGLGYAPYINLLCAMLLLVSPPAQAFHTLINLLSRPLMSAFFTPSQPEIDAYYRVLENLQADRYPKIYANCKSLGVGVPESWFRSLLVEQVGWEGGVRLWDQIVLDGDGFVFRAALAVLGFLEPRLYFPDREECISVLEGHNPASMAILKRERERARLRGEIFIESVDGTLGLFGVNEGVLFGRLENDEWRESAFERLVLREMPD
ncbi:uncharacterized protein L203_102643 [Cryptococcus depauperatus CBS 7841]|uniref:Rab-GAP TBC domain-containing protein n=1 Tax=Cryptococcus depauperatus CBS 7841 TaxID=1295531 RepID=A0AAJ8JSB4_9TREE